MKLMTLSILGLVAFISSAHAVAITHSDEIKVYKEEYKHKYVYNFPPIISCNNDIHLVSNLLKTSYAHDDLVKISELVKEYNIKFDVSNDYLIRELNILAVHAVMEERPELAINIAKSYNSRNDDHIIALGIIAKAMITQGYSLEALKVIKELNHNDQHNSYANKALGAIAKRAAYTPGAEPIAFEIEKNRPNIDKEIRDDIDKRKSTYDKHVWQAKILLIEKSRPDREKEISEIIKIYDPTTKDGSRKLTILAKSALRVKRFDIATDIINKLAFASHDNYRALGSIAKAAIFIHGGIPVAVDVASKLGDDEYSYKVKKLVAQIASEHMGS